MSAAVFGPDDEALVEFDGTTGAITDADLLESSLGYAPGSLVGRDFYELLSADSFARIASLLGVLLDHPGRIQPVSPEFRAPDGSPRLLPALMWNTGRPGAEPTICLLRSRSIHQDRLAASQYAATHEDQILADSVRSARQADEPGAVVMVRVEDLDVVEAALGVDASAHLLTLAARRARSGLSTAVVSVGDGLLAAAPPGVRDVDDALEIARVVRDRFAMPFDIHGTEIFVSSRVSIAIGDVETRLRQLLATARAAIADTTPRSRVKVVSARSGSQARSHLTERRDIRNAIEQDELVLHYQPIYDLRSGALVAAEALMRWHHPRRGLLLPTSFITLAEETDFIDALGRWAIRRACEQIASWRELIRESREFAVAVNISAQQLQDGRLSAFVAETLEHVGLEPQYLRLELTESALLDSSSAALAVLDEINQLGVGLSIDDFGTGYATLEQLRNLPTASVKIDRSFIHDITVSDESAAIVEGTIRLASSLGRSTIAEGIETRAQLEMLRAMRCTHGQGFWLGPPLASDEFAPLLVDADTLT